MYSPKSRNKSKKMAKKSRKPNSTAARARSLRKKPTRNGRSKPASLAQKRRRKIKWGRLGFVILVAFGLGYGVAWMIRSGIPKLAASIGRDWRQITAGPTILPYSSSAYQALSENLTTYLSKQPGTYGVAGIDLNTGAGFGWNQTQEFTASTTTALPVALDLYNQIANHKITPNAFVKYTPADKEAGSGFIAGMPFGTSFTVLQLAHASIAQNDVVATNMLIRRLGAMQIGQYLISIGINQPFRPPYVTTPQNLSLEMANLYHLYTANTTAFLPLIDLLEGNAPQGRLESGFPKGVNVAQIASNWPKEYHDSALIFIPGHPLALSICSDGVTEAQAAQVERHAAGMVAAFVNRGGRG